MVVDKLIVAGLLPRNYGNAARNLLPRNGALLGREHELRRVLSALESERQITIVAGPGEGKTALAAEAAHVLSDIGWLPGGAYAVDLSTAPAAGEHRPSCPTWPQRHTYIYGPTLDSAFRPSLDFCSCLPVLLPLLITIQSRNLKATRMTVQIPCL